MERERLTRLLEEPGQVARQDLAGLATLAEKYPWFSSAQLLRTAGERQAGEVLFDETLRTTSAHLPSRAALFDLVHIPPILREIQPEPTEHRGPVQVIDVPQPPIPPVEAPKAEVLLTIVPPQEEIIPAIPVPAPPPEREPGSEQALDLQIMEAALASAYDLTWSEQAVPDEPLTPAAPKAFLPADPKPSPTPRVDVHSKLKFTAWLETAEPSTSTPPPAAPPEGLSGDVQDWLRSPMTGDRPTPVKGTVSAATDTNALIDRFIHHETPDPSTKAAFYSPQKAAKKSLEDTAGLVTETLARIFEKQGNLPKAIDTYRRLALKYPEKGAYFAALQKELEAQSNA